MHVFHFPSEKNWLPLHNIFSKIFDPLPILKEVYTMELLQNDAKHFFKLYIKQ